MEAGQQAQLRDLPSVDSVLNSDAAAVLLARFGRAASTARVRAVLTEARAALQAGASTAPSAEHLATLVLAQLDAEDRSGLRPVFNLTGTVLHLSLIHI